MSKFDGKRLPDELFQLDTHRLRQGWYSDAYFSNIVKILSTLSAENYTHAGSDIGDIVVEMQFMTRRKPFSLVAGVDEALAILRNCAGYYDENREFVNTFDQLEVEAVEDGTFVYYDGNPMNVQPVIKIRGRYRDFAMLETPMLGVLTEATRVATNVYNTLKAANGKDVLFFPARFAHYKMQALHGYAYSLAVQAYNETHENKTRASVSTDDQGEWWGASGGGTIAHASIACFLGDTAEVMMQFARLMPVSVPRIALVDFHNDCVAETRKVMEVMFAKYLDLYLVGNLEEAEKYKLHGVRLDTSANMRDVSVAPLGDRKLDNGVNPRLVWNVRQAIDDFAKNPPFRSDNFKNVNLAEVLREWVGNVKIVVTGGFDVEKITLFEDLRVPVDIYGVGSSLLANGKGTNNDYTADIVRVQVEGEWKPMAKKGRRVCDNPNLKPYKG